MLDLKEFGVWYSNQARGGHVFEHVHEEVVAGAVSNALKSGFKEFFLDVFYSSTSAPSKIDLVSKPA